jgi:hypothetical protein
MYFSVSLNLLICFLSLILHINSSNLRHLCLYSDLTFRFHNLNPVTPLNLSSQVSTEKMQFNFYHLDIDSLDVHI